MTAVETVTCTGKDGELRDFTLAASESLGPEPKVDDPNYTGRHWTIAVHLRGPEHIGEDDFFAADAVEVDATTVMTKELHANAGHYAGKGIPQAVMSYLKRRTGCRVVSSTFEKSHRIFDVEWQSSKGFEMWRYLESVKLAKELPGEYRFEYTGP